MSFEASFLSRRATPMASDERTLVDELWRTEETARQFKVSVRTVKRYENEPNGLPFIKIGGKCYNKPSSARAWLEARETRANPSRPIRTRVTLAAGRS
jgi:hypothetical protein